MNIERGVRETLDFPLDLFHPGKYGKLKGQVISEFLLLEMYWSGMVFVSDKERKLQEFYDNIGKESGKKKALIRIWVREDHVKKWR